MMPHRFLPKNLRRVAIVGLAKNVGKTTALNALLDGLATEGERVGLMSVGVDGETFDAIGGHAKPPVSVARDTLICTSDSSLRQCETSYEVISTTGIRSTLGEVLVVRATRAGEVILSGVRHRKDVKALTQRLIELGAERVVIDGAFDRVAAASPEAADAIIGVVGLEIGDTIEEVVDRSAAWVARLQIAAWEGPAPNRGLCAWREGEWQDTDGSLVLAPFGGEPVEAVYAPGLISDASLKHAAGSLTEGGTLIAEDSTRIMATRRGLSLFLRSRELRVRIPVRLAAVCANPRAVSGRSVLSGELVAALGRAISKVPILDVVSGAESMPC